MKTTVTDRVSAAFRCIQVLKPGDYRNRPLPPDAITSVESLVDVFFTEPSDRTRIVESVRPEFSFVFFMFAANAAVEAVRRHNPALLTRGLLALAVENLTFDFRDTLRILAQLYNSARLLGLDAAAIFAAVSEYSCAPFAKTVGQFPRRPEDLLSLKAFGIRVTKPPQPFSYVVEWKPPSRIHKFIESLRDLVP